MSRQLGVAALFRAPAFKGRYSQRTLGIVLAVLLATSALCVVAVRYTLQASAAPDFALLDQDGRAFTLSAIRGHPIALFFGFTHCPDECPTTLAHLAKAAHAAGVPADWRVAFITVDPRRDSPAVLKRYVRLFDPRFIGLTGRSTALDPVYAAYHALPPAAPLTTAGGEETFEHGTTVYYIGRNGAIKGLGAWDDGPPEMARDFIAFQ